MTKPASNRFFFIPRSNERTDIPFDGKVVAEVKDASHTEGLAGLAAGYAGARFDNFSLIAE